MASLLDNAKLRGPASLQVRLLLVGDTRDVSFGSKIWTLPGIRLDALFRSLAV